MTSATPTSPAFRSCRFHSENGQCRRLPLNGNCHPVVIFHDGDVPTKILTKVVIELEIDQFITAKGQNEEEARIKEHTHDPLSVINTEMPSSGDYYYYYRHGRVNPSLKLITFHAN